MRQIISLVLIFLSFSSFAQDTKSNKIVESLNKGQEYISEGKYSKAYSEYIKAYELGETVLAPFQIAELFYNGLGVDKNTSESFKWYKISADSGNSQAAYLTAYAYHNGEGVKQSFESALHYYHQACTTVPNANLAIGLLMRDGLGTIKDVPTAYKYIKKGAEMGSPDAQFVLATGYLMGYGNLPKDKEKACIWMEKAAQQGNIQALIWLNENK